MDKIKLAIVALGFSGLALGGCTNMMGDDDPAMAEPAAGPMQEGEGDTGMTESDTGEMMDSDDDEGAEGGTTGTTQ